jgi:hypothetical protein
LQKRQGRKVFAGFPPTVGIDVQALAHDGSLLPGGPGQGSQYLVEGALGGCSEAAVAGGPRLHQYQCAQLSLIKRRDLRPPFLAEFPAALCAAEGAYRDTRSAERLKVAVNGALRNFKRLRKFALRNAPASLEKKQE